MHSDVYDLHLRSWIHTDRHRHICTNNENSFLYHNNINTCVYICIYLFICLFIYFIYWFCFLFFHFFYLLITWFLFIYLLYIYVHTIYIYGCFRNEHTLHIGCSVTILTSHPATGWDAPLLHESNGDAGRSPNKTYKIWGTHRKIWEKSQIIFKWRLDAKII